jgi:excisionase family DNA binding protein
MNTTFHADIEQAIRSMVPITASQSERPKLREASRILLEALQAPRRKKCVLIGPDGKEVPLPKLVFSMLNRVCEVLAQGDSLSIVPTGKELTTQQAAKLLNVSRQYLVRLLEERHIPFTKTGKHRRLRIEDVLQYKTKRDQERRTKLEELIRLSEETTSKYPAA